MNRSTKGFISFKAYLFIPFLRSCMFLASCFRHSEKRKEESDHHKSQNDLKNFQTSNTSEFKSH